MAEGQVNQQPCLYVMISIIRGKVKGKARNEKPPVGGAVLGSYQGTNEAELTLLNTLSLDTRQGTNKGRVAELDLPDAPNSTLSAPELEQEAVSG